MAKGSWRSTEEYRLHEDNPNVKFRPGLDKLVSKMRSLTILKDRPDSVAELIDDLAYHYLVREKPRPDVLWYIVGRLMYKFGQLTGGWEWVGNDYALVAEKMEIEQRAFLRRQEDAPEKVEAYPNRFIDQAVAAGVRDPEELVGATVDATIQEGWDQRVKDLNLKSVILDPPKEPDAYVEGYLHGYKAGRDGEAKWIDSAGGLERAEESVIGVGDAPVDWTDEGLKAIIARTIRLHKSQTIHVDGTIKCACKRDYDGPYNWADHVRKRIWKEMKKYGEGPSQEEV